MIVSKVIQTEQPEDIYGDAESTVIKLGSDVNGEVKKLSFDEAFDEYSEARGWLKKAVNKVSDAGKKAAEKRRLKREAFDSKMKKKAEQRRLKKEDYKKKHPNLLHGTHWYDFIPPVAAAKALDKGLNIGAGKALKDAKARRKAKAKAFDDKMKKKAEDRRLRKEAKQREKNAPKESYDENIQDENVGYEQGNEEQGYNQQYQDENGYVDNNSYEDETENEGGSYGNTSDEGDEGNYQENQGGWDFQGGYEDEGEDEQGSYNEDETGNIEDDSLVEDESGMEGNTDEDSYASGKVQIDPKLHAAAMRYEWHVHQIEKLKRQIDNMRVTNGAGQMRRVQLLRQIGKHKQAMENINSGLNTYATSNADGDGGRARMVQLARRRAYMARMKHNMKHKQRNIPVDRDLKPQLNKNRIVVPPSSSADGSEVKVEDLKMNDEEVGLTGGTGVIALDATNDLGAPETKVIEVFSSADGTEGGKSNMALKIGVGVALGVAAIYLIKKYKIVK